MFRPSIQPASNALMLTSTNMNLSGAPAFSRANASIVKLLGGQGLGSADSNTGLRRRNVDPGGSAVGHRNGDRPDRRRALPSVDVERPVRLGVFRIRDRRLWPVRHHLAAADLGRRSACHRRPTADPALFAGAVADGRAARRFDGRHDAVFLRRYRAHAARPCRRDRLSRPPCRRDLCLRPRLAAGLAAARRRRRAFPCP